MALKGFDPVETAPSQRIGYILRKHVFAVDWRRRPEFECLLIELDRKAVGRSSG